MTQPARASQSGFTLLEMVVALAVLAMVSVAITAQLKLEASAWTRTRAAQDRVDHVHAFHFLQDYLFASALPVTIEDRRRSHVIFQGTDDFVVFAGLGSAPPVDQGLNVYGMELLATQDGRRLRVYRSDLATYLNGYDVRDAGIVSDLGGVPDDVRFAYFGQPDGARRTRRDDADWHDEWEDQPTLPVGIVLARAADDEALPIFAARFNVRDRSICLDRDSGQPCDVREDGE